MRHRRSSANARAILSLKSRISSPLSAYQLFAYLGISILEPLLDLVTSALKGRMALSFTCQKCRTAIFLASAIHLLARLAFVPQTSPWQARRRALARTLQ